MNVTVHFSGGFGNNIKQWIIGCLVADKYKKNITIRKHYHLINNEDSMLSIYKVLKYPKNEQIPINLIADNVKFDIIDMQSPFLMKEIYSIRKFINDNYFDWNVIQMPFIPEKNDIVISLRLGGINEVANPSPYIKEYPPNEGDGYRIPFEYYRKVLDVLIKDDIRLIICCDNFEDPFLNNFNIYPNIVLAKYSTLIQFNILRLATNIISPYSSFCHMAILLSDAPNTWIFNPKNNKITIETRESYF